MSNYNLKLIQDVSYQILIDFDDFCAKHNLTYYMTYGTLIGAACHQDFIPWDDDIDVSMPREDYDRLLNELEKDLPAHLSLHHFKNTESYHLNFAKIFNKNTIIIEKAGQFNYRIGGAYIDIFPIDGVGNSYKTAVRKRKKLLLLLPFISISYLKLDKKKRPLWKNAAIWFSKLFDTKKLQYRLEKIVKKNSFQESSYVAMCVGQYRLGEILPKEVYGTPVKLKFRDRYFNAPQDYDRYLSSIYGDYMRLPPEEKRISGHNFVYVDLNKSYLDIDKDEIIKQLESDNQ
ncbi:MAG TPA: LicD family protein [Clostridiales bacterium]|nr:LicD family protein [Clostridiales bacterium]